jgi:hypothetical protein
MTETPDVSQNYVRVLFRPQVGRPWLEQWYPEKKFLNFPIGSRITGKRFRAAGWQP